MPDAFKKPWLLAGKSDNEYWQALGMFIELFSVTEYFLFRFLAKQTGISEDVGKAIFSGTRSDAAIQYIERIWQIKDPGEKVKVELRGAFAQLKAINNIRNIAVHNHSVLRDAGQSRFVTNSGMALTPDRVKEARISPEILRDICTDLNKITTHLVTHTFRPKQNRASAGVRRSAWRYKPPSNQNQSAKKPGHKDRG